MSIEVYSTNMTIFTIQRWKYICATSVKLDLKGSFNPFKRNGFFPQLSIGTVLFCFKGCWVVFFHFYSNFNRTFCKQTVETPIRRHIVQHQIWVCAVCLCPTKRRGNIKSLVGNQSRGSHAGTFVDKNFRPPQHMLWLKNQSIFFEKYEKLI